MLLRRVLLLHLFLLYVHSPVLLDSDIVGDDRR